MGAIGFETLSARQFEINGSSSIGYTLFYTNEETCEMLGIALFAKHLLSYMAATFKDLTFKFQSEDNS